MIDNTSSTNHPFAHIHSQKCPACDDNKDHFFACFHIESGYIDQCTTCHTQFDSDGLPLEEPTKKFKKK